MQANLFDNTDNFIDTVEMPDFNPPPGVVVHLGCVYILDDEFHVDPPEHRYKQSHGFFTNDMSGNTE